MAIYDFFVSRNNSVSNTAAYVGHVGRLFYDSNTGVIKISDGQTPGGVFIPYNIATETTIGGIKAGPGANVSVDGTLTIDTTGLPLSFGDFTANVNILTLVNNDQNMVLATKGSAEVQLVGNIGFYKSNGFPPNVSNRYFQALDDGQIKILVPGDDPITGAVEIVGSTSGQAASTVNAGVMLHITGQNDSASRFYNDGVGGFAAFVGRRLNGSVVSPTAVQAGDEIIRISSTGHNGTTIPGVGSARIVFQAIETYTPSAIGSNISLWTTAVGSNVLTKIATVDSANGVTATQFNTAGNVTASRFNGNISGSSVVGAVATATSLGVATSILAGQITINPANIVKNTASVQTFTITGLTTSHKILALPASPLTYGVVVSAAWPSALNTLSIEFQNATNTDVDLGNINIDYFAWI